MWSWQCPPYHTTWLVLRWLSLLGITGFTGHSFRPNMEKGRQRVPGGHLVLVYPTGSKHLMPSSFSPNPCTLEPCPLVATVGSRIGGVMDYKDSPSLLTQEWDLRQCEPMALSSVVTLPQRWEGGVEGSTQYGRDEWPSFLFWGTERDPVLEHTKVSHRVRRDRTASPRLFLSSVYVLWQYRYGPGLFKWPTRDRSVQKWKRGWHWHRSPQRQVRTWCLNVAGLTSS